VLVICPQGKYVYLPSNIKKGNVKYVINRLCHEIFHIVPGISTRHDIFHIGPDISPRLPYQAWQLSWRADMGRGLIPGTIWKISWHNLFITYFTLPFFIFEGKYTYLPWGQITNTAWDLFKPTRTEVPPVSLTSCSYQ
jgi:hypothetical protein